jgi:hypothetical protein
MLNAKTQSRKELVSSKNLRAFAPLRLCVSSFFFASAFAFNPLALAVP